MRVGGAQVVGHGGAEMRFAGQQNGFGATGQVGFVFLRQEGGRGRWFSRGWPPGQAESSIGVYGPPDCTSFLGIKVLLAHTVRALPAIKEIANDKAALVPTKQLYG